jgi:hypothetical protein
MQIEEIHMHFGTAVVISGFGVNSAICPSPEKLEFIFVIIMCRPDHSNRCYS